MKRSWAVSKAVSALQNQGNKYSYTADVLLIASSVAKEASTDLA